jgi:carotenoid cleavage dioxygenase-like enzyme
MHIHALARLSVFSRDHVSRSSVFTESIAEFPVINPTLTGRRAQYVYYATVARESCMPVFDGVVKVGRRANLL